MNAFKSRIVQDRISRLAGEILTIADASLAEHQKKAVKDLIKRAFGDTQEWFLEKSLEKDAANENGWGTDLVEYEANFVTGPLVGPNVAAPARE